MTAPVGVVRITTFHAQPGHLDGLREAARGNAAAAREADGCLSAEVCVAADEKDTLLVVSRWDSERALRAFLGWHEGIAHGAVSPHLAGRPVAAHHPVLPG